MKIKSELKKPISNNQLFLTLAVIIIALGISLSPFRQIFNAICLFVGWAGTVVGLLRYGKRALQPLSIMFLVGITLFWGSDLLPVNANTAGWVRGIGSILLVVVGLMSLFTFRQPPQQPNGSK